MLDKDQIDELISKRNQIERADSIDILQEESAKMIQTLSEFRRLKRLSDEASKKSHLLEEIWAYNTYLHKKEELLLSMLNVFISLLLVSETCDLDEIESVIKRIVMTD